MLGLGPHASFIIAAYAVAFVTLAFLVISIVANDRKQRRLRSLPAGDEREDRHEYRVEDAGHRVDHGQREERTATARPGR